MLGGMLVTGVGVGLTLPTFMAAGASSLPPQSFATGSAVINMLRQVGLAVGVALLVAVLGTPSGAGAREAGFHHGWILIAAVSLASALAGFLVLGSRPAAAVALTPRSSARAVDQPL
jgi:MFS family permease